MSRLYRFRQSSAEIAKFRFSESFNLKVVMPTKLPASSNKPPPEEPEEIGAVVLINRLPASVRLPEISPSDIVSSSPAGAPIE